MPLLIVSIALLILASALLLATLVVIVGWMRQDRAIRRMKRELAERLAAAKGSAHG